MSEKQAELLAEKVANTVIASGVREEILKALLNSVKANVHEAMLEALLLYAGGKIGERDKEWVGHLSTIWAPKSQTRVTTPAEVEEEIRKWVMGRETDLILRARKEGFEEGFHRALDRGTRLGWGASSAGKGLEETLKSLERIKAE